MLAVARRRFGNRVQLVEASADSLPFEDRRFDHLTFTYLFRYVDDPRATLVELARVVRPDGVIASLEFGVPEGLSRPLWDLYVDAVLPLAGRALRSGWRGGRRFPRRLDPRLLGDVPDRSPARALARRRTPRCRGATPESGRWRRHVGAKAMSNARLRLAFAGETSCRGWMLGQPPGFPRPLPLVRFADKALRAFPRPLPLVRFADKALRAFPRPLPLVRFADKALRAFPRPLPLVRFADKALRAFPTPFHVLCQPRLAHERAGKSAARLVRAGARRLARLRHACSTRPTPRGICHTS